MALFKISKGLSTSLPEAITEGYCWYTYNDSKFYIDFKDENGVLSRKALNAQEAEKLTGYDITTILNSSNNEIPTSHAVFVAIEDAAVNNQSDWSVNDETSPAYVKNRTHWSKVTQVEILPECQPEKTDAGIIIRDKISIVAGHTYIVNWNGTSYTCIACPFEGAAFIGNGSYMGMDDTGEPFMIGCYTEEMAQYTGYYVIIMPLDGSTTCTLSIIERIEEIQKIDNKYLPDEVFANPDWNAPEGEPGHILNRTHYTEEALEEIIPETTVTFGDPTKPGYDTGTAIGNAIQIYPERGEMFAIEWNGIMYYSAVREYTKTDGSFGRGIGNTGMFGGGSYRQYPFLIGFLTEKEAATAGYTYFVSVEDESTTTTFSVSRVGEAVHKLDAKYLPENVATEEYVNTAIDAANMIYVGPDMPTDPNIKVWINTAEEGTGIVPVLPRVATITLAAANWSGSTSPYSQVVNINTVTSATKVELNPTVSQIVSLQSNDIALMAENNAGVVTVYSFGDKPSADMTMQVTLTEVSYV